MPEPYIVRTDGEVVDLILWRRHGVRGLLMVENTLGSNPGTGELGPVLPLGTVLLLPDPPAQTTLVPAPVSLFD